MNSSTSGNAGALYDGLTADEIISAFSSQQLQSYLNVACGALFVYSYLTTLAKEVETIWSRGFSIGTFLFCHIRYLALVDCRLGSAMLSGKTELTAADLDTEHCRVWFYFGWALTILINGHIATFAGLRVWAVTRGSSGMAAMTATLPVLLLNAGSLGINMAVYLRHISFRVDITFSCSDAIRIGEDMDLTFPGPLPLAISSSISGLLFRDSLTDFALLLLLSSLDLAYLQAFKLYDPLPTILDILTYILICNLMLELRSINETSNSSTTTEQSVNFAIRSDDNPVGRSSSSVEHTCAVSVTMADSNNPPFAKNDTTVDRSSSLAESILGGADSVNISIDSHRLSLGADLCESGSEGQYSPATSSLALLSRDDACVDRLDV
ncbi:hypothetical protein EIP91_005301 [Steccherinum ochraceum]|uniref:DUF6533 domain-containing protein n=1 Tax=Steccherinum ochraceum TaxID=92696 RepID=A0A4R0R7D2_9APHY|nr:hypothetical protein EIP91_005301 [Steccherinum ochraceum]